MGSFQYTEIVPYWERVIKDNTIQICVTIAEWYPKGRIY